MLIAKYYSRFGEHLTSQRWQYLLNSCGSFAAIFLLISLAISRNIPPTAPWWDAERLYTHYWTYIKGTRAASVFFMVSGALYVPYSAAITSQIRHIPNLNPTIPDLQLASAAAGFCAFMVPATLLAAMTFRDYGPELTQLMNDLFWLSMLLPWPIFWVQWWTTAWAVFSDNSPDPVFPKAMGWINLIAPIVFALGSGIHMHVTGPFAWNGGLVFWPTIVLVGLEINCSCWYIMRNLRRKRNL